MCTSLRSSIESRTRHTFLSFLRFNRHYRVETVFYLAVCLFVPLSLSPSLLILSVLRVITCDRAARGSTRSAVDRAIAAPGSAMGPDPVAVDLAVLAAGAAASSLHQ